MKTARVILTTKCNRSCHYCCNEQPQTMPSAIPLRFIEQLAGYDSVVITGGEPMLYPERVVALSKAIKALKDMPVFMYSATYTKYTRHVMQYLDGITYSIHEEATPKDVALFKELQTVACIYHGTDPKFSFNLNVHDNCNMELPIVPRAWNRVKFFHHMDECPVPANETLFILQMEVL